MREREYLILKMMNMKMITVKGYQEERRLINHVVAESSSKVGYHV